MATREQFAEMIGTRPFVPFVIKLASGGSFVVNGPELASCNVAGRSLWVHDDDGTHLVEMLLVEKAEAETRDARRDGVERR